MNIKTLKKRREKAAAITQKHAPMDDDIRRYVTPYRGGVKLDDKGQDKVSEAFDQTPIIAGMRFAGKLQRDISPVDGGLYLLKPGPLVEPRFGKPVYEKLSESLGLTSIVTASFNHSGEWDTAFWEMGCDLVGGTGFMLMLEGDSDVPARYFTPPADEVDIDAGPYGEVDGRFWSRKWSIRTIRQTWPDAKFGKNVAKKEKEDPEQEVVLHQDTIWLADKKRWEMTIWCKEDDKAIVPAVRSRACPWLSPRYYKLAGEVRGRGVGNLAMPAIKTLNTAQRLTLMAASIALMGIYTAVDDGVFNPDLSPIAPGAIWKVRANGGVFGPSVQRMEAPRMDLQNISIEELRIGIKTAMLDDNLPPQTGSVRSPTEILERVKRLAQDHMGAFGRLIREIIIPKAKRDIEIAFNLKLIPNDIPIDQLLVRVEVSSPVAQARETERVQNIINWLELVLSVATAAGTQPKYIAQVEDALAEVGRAMGVPDEFILTEDQRNQSKAADQAKALALAAAQGGAQLDDLAGAASAGDGGEVADAGVAA